MQVQKANPGYKCINVIHNIYHEVPEDWQICMLRNFATEINQRYSNEKDGPVLSVTKHRGFVKSLQYFKRQVYSKDIKDYKLVEKGDFAYATIHLDEGSLGLLKEFDRGFVSPMYTVFRINPSIVDSDFIFLLLKSKLYLQIYRAIGQGSIDRRKSIYFDNLCQLNVAIPSLKEQKRYPLLFQLLISYFKRSIKVLL